MDAESDDACKPISQTWHLCWRAACGRDFLSHAVLRDLIRDRLVAAHRSPERILLAYSVLPAEIHAVTRLSGKARPGDIANAFGHVVARWVRRVQRVNGPVLAGPFSAVAIHSARELHHLVRMLAWRPVALGLARVPAEHVPGSVRIALGASRPAGFSARELLHEFASTVPAARRRLREAIGERPSAEEWRVWELAHGIVPVADASNARSASAIRARTIAAVMLLAASDTQDVDGALRLLERSVAHLIRPQGTSDAPARPDDEGLRVRALVALLATRHRLCSAARVARFYSRAKSTLSEQMAQARRRPGDKRIVGAAIEVIVAHGRQRGGGD